jgi:hypothetical protein
MWKYTLFLIAAMSVNAAEPGPRWAEPTSLDLDWSEKFYPVDQGAVVPRARRAGETEQETQQLDAAWETAIRAYLRRVDNMVAGMNLEDEAARMRHCEIMANYMDDDFQHIEGRRRGFVIRTKPQVIQACANRAFRLSGFRAKKIHATVVSPDLVQVVVCYDHDQYNDPLVKGDGVILPNGRESIPRTAVETITTRPGHPARIRLHVAQDADTTLITKGCGAL